jgi:transcriptional regulator with XRE-family HTH domain
MAFKLIAKPLFDHACLEARRAGAAQWRMPRKPKPGTGNFIALWRVAAGMTQEQLAELSDMTAANLSRIESGKSGYTKSSLENIALALQVEPWQLLGQRPGSADAFVQRLQTAAPEQIAQIQAVAETLLAFAPAPSPPKQSN